MWALVTGAMGGIGGAVAAELSAREVRAVGLDHRQAAGQYFVETAVCDLAESTQVDTVIGELLERRGPPRWFVSAVGSYTRTPIGDYSSGLFDEAVRNNFGAVFFPLKALLPAMARGGGGRVVLLASQAGAAGGTDPVYAAMKAATIALSKSVAREFAAAGVLCDAVSPGPVDTPMAQVMGDERRHYEDTIPIGRLITAEEVAELVCWLLFARGGAVTGATFDIDGGLVRR